MARLHFSPWLGLDRRDDSGIERELGAVPQREAVGDDLDAPLVADGRVPRGSCQPGARSVQPTRQLRDTHGRAHARVGGLALPARGSSSPRQRQ